MGLKELRKKPDVRIDGEIYVCKEAYKDYLYEKLKLALKNECFGNDEKTGMELAMQIVELS